MIEDIVGRETVYHLPTLISGIDQLLAVPKLSSGKGEATASAIYETAVDWDICEKMKCSALIQLQPIPDLEMGLAFVRVKNG